MRLECTIESRAALEALRLALGTGRPGHGEVLVRVRIDGVRDPLVRLGRDFALDGELVDRLAQVPGLSDVTLAPVRGATHLRLVA
jgi:DNA polymerase-3 subunit alpha